jgi:hypothetical protein
MRGFHDRLRQHEQEGWYSPGLARSDLIPHWSSPSFLPWLTDSYISNLFLSRGLLIALMMEAARTSETLVNFYQTTQCYNPEDSHLHFYQTTWRYNTEDSHLHLYHFHPAHEHLTSYFFLIFSLLLPVLIKFFSETVS